MLKIHEVSSATGGLSALFLRFEGGVLEIVGDDGADALPAGALDAVMRRYGAPFDPEARVSLVASLALDQGRALRHVRHLAGYDVIARDYLVYDTSDQEPLCAMSATVAVALAHLGRAQRLKG
jgi:hypothetical protein